MTLWKDPIATTRVQAYLRTRLGWDSWTRTLVDQWGNADTSSPAQTWALLFGPAAQLFVNGSAGITSCNSVNATRGASLPVGDHTDIETVVDVLVPVIPATAGIRSLHLVRFQDSNNYLYARVEVTTSSTVQVSLRKTVGGLDFQVAAPVTVTGLTHSTTVPLTVRCRVTGQTLMAKVWLSSDDPPDDDEWNVTAWDEAIAWGSSVAFAAILASGNTNTLPVNVAWDNLTVYSPAQWTTISTVDEVLVGPRGAPLTGRVGRSTELAQIDPSELGLILDDRDGRYTPGNQTSPLYPDWTSGVPIRVTETIGARTFPWPDAYLELPENYLTFELSSDPSRSDRTMAARCIDLLTRLTRAPRFVSNLGAYIIGQATASALRGYWPLVDASGATYASAAGPVSQGPLRFTQIASYTPIRFVDSLLNFGRQDGPPGDDATAVEFTPTPGTNTWPRLANSELTQMETNPGASASNPDVATLLTWVYVPPEVTALDQLALWREFTTGALYILVDGYASSGGTTWRVDFQTEGGQGSAIGSSIVAGRWHFIGAQLEFNLGDFALWVDGEPPASGSIGLGGTFGGLPLDRIVLDGSEGSANGVRMAHLQLYIGDANAYTHEDFLAQYEIGINGFGQTTVDQRIRQICNYAGIGDGQLDLEESDSLIQEPAFAGQRPGAVASAAATTGGGILFTRGAELIYHDRKHRFNL